MNTREHKIFENLQSGRRTEEFGNRCFTEFEQ